MKSQAVALRAAPSRAADFLALTKPRLNSLVVVTAGVGYYLAAPGVIDLPTLLHTIVGAALVAGGAAAFNQVAERDLDEAMERTRRRPMPSGRIAVGEARTFAMLLSAIGVAQLALFSNWLAMTVALITLVSYVAVYTPLKRLTPWATLVGAIPGALPPLIGWAAARGTLDAGAWTLFGIVFLWQLPHFHALAWKSSRYIHARAWKSSRYIHALAWMYREDFRRARVPLLAVLDPDGSRTSTHALAYTVLLVPVSLLPAMTGLGGPTYLVGATLAGLAFLILAGGFAREHTAGRARALFHGSLVYLPLLWGLLVIDRVL